MSKALLEISREPLILVVPLLCMSAYYTVVIVELCVDGLGTVVTVECVSNVVSDLLIWCPGVDEMCCVLNNM